MISRRIARAAPSVSLSVLLLAACGSGQSGTGSQTGEARLQAQLRIRGDDGAETLACGAFTFQPYAVSAASTMTNAGDAIVLESNGSADSPATTIAGCIAGAEDAAGYNWAFIVTATDAADCASGEPIAVSPSVEAYMLLLDCKAGLDVPASVSLVMSPATPTAGG